MDKYQKEIIDNLLKDKKEQIQIDIDAKESLEEKIKNERREMEIWQSFFEEEV